MNRFMAVCLLFLQVLFIHVLLGGFYVNCLRRVAWLWKINTN